MPHVAIRQPSLRNHNRPLWAVQQSGPDAAGDTLRLGEDCFTRAEIAGFEVSQDHTAYRHGRFLAALLFALLAAIILIGITALAWQWRYMLAVIILAVLSGMALQDVYLAQTSRLYRFTVRLENGRQVRLAIPDAASAAALTAVLSRRG